MATTAVQRYYEDVEPGDDIGPMERQPTAEQVAAYLRERLYQDSYTIQAPDKTVWISFQEQQA